MKRLLLMILLCMLAKPAWAIDASFNPKDWQAFKGVHFVVLCPSSDDEDLAHKILQHAESYYNIIADRIGYSRYQDFWTWDQRVKIIVFDSQAAYSQATGQPIWSQGFASVHSDFFKSRIIVSFKDQPRFMKVLLPHEIGHLILHDFIGFNKPIPRFFDEGVAQLQQKDDSLDHIAVMAGLHAQGKDIPIPELVNYDLGQHQDAQSVEIFYAESLYIVDFLVKTYGEDAFRDLCRNLRDGDDFAQALKSAYYPSLDSIADLQQKWDGYLKQYL